MTRSGRNHIRLSAALAALLLVGAQTLVAVHDHEPVGEALCVLCSVSSDASLTAITAGLPARSPQRSSMHNPDLQAGFTRAVRHTEPRAPPVI